MYLHVSAHRIQSHVHISADHFYILQSAATCSCHFIPETVRLPNVWSIHVFPYRLIKTEFCHSESKQDETGSNKTEINQAQAAVLTHQGYKAHWPIKQKTQVGTHWVANEGMRGKCAGGSVISLMVMMGAHWGKLNTTVRLQKLTQCKKYINLWLPMCHYSSIEKQVVVLSSLSGWYASVNGWEQC